MKQKYKIGQKVRIKIYDTEGIISDIVGAFYMIENIGYFDFELEPINNFNIKQLYKPLLAIFILAMIYIAFKGCDKPKPIIDNSIKDTIAVNNLDLNIALANNKDLRIANDSLSKLPPIYRTKYKHFYDTIYKEAPDTCHYYLSQLNRKCVILDSINEQTISSYAEVLQSDLQVFAKYEKLNKSRIKQSINDSLVIDSLVRSKKKYFKGLKHGIIIGAIITQGLNSGSQFIK